MVRVNKSLRKKKIVSADNISLSQMPRARKGRRSKEKNSEAKNLKPLTALSAQICSE